MSEVANDLLLKLEKNLEGVVKVYRHLLSVVRREKEILIAANLDDLNENNRTKEATLLKARELERERLQIAKELALQENLDPEKVRLLDFARHFDGEVGDRLRRTHSVLELLLKRVREHNSHNEQLVNSALDNISGAMETIRESISEKKSYKKGGKLQESKTDVGQLVSREA